MDVTAIVLSFLSVVKLATVFAFVLGIIFIGRRYGSKNRHRGISGPPGEEQAALDDLGRIAEKMDRRLETLERILEVENPKWKEHLQ